MPRPFVRRALLLAAMFILPACSGTVGCEPQAHEMMLAVPAIPNAAPLPPVCRGSDVTLVVTPSADGVVHVHGYDAEAPATPVGEGEVVELSFTANRSGQFPIEFHTDESTEGMTVGILTVNEP